MYDICFLRRLSDGCARLYGGAQCVQGQKRTAAYISQTAVTAQSLVMLIIVARAQLNAWMFLPAGSEYEVMRYGVFAAVAASCIAVACVGRVYDVLLCAVVSSVSLPYIDLLPYKAAAVIFCAAEFLLIARALLLMRVCRRDIKMSCRAIPSSSRSMSSIRACFSASRTEIYCL